MKQINPFIKFSFIVFTISILLYSCSKDDDEPLSKTDINKTSLFGEVIVPENTNRDSDFSILSDALIESSVKSDFRFGNPNEQFEPGILTAGEWSDLNNWDFWNNLLSDQEYYKEANKWNLKEIKRYSFFVKDNNASAVANCKIKLLYNQVEVWKTKTDAKGEATLWSDLEINELKAEIEIDGTKQIITNVKEYAIGINDISINKTIINKKNVDIYFAVDATGSMGDEIDYLKAELNNVIQRIKQNNTSLEMRFGSVFYRDEGDDYVTRPFNFTTNQESLISFISKQSANGGGDFPEAVHTALDIAITQNSWNDDASTRILFLLLDAPPHYTQEVISNLESNITLAAEKGIKIIPITASGIDKPTEYLMRSFAILTNGTYVFITDDSGVGNSHIKPTIGEFSVEKLNDLMVRVVDNYIPK
ncbi:VWA domain-containing protein [uncultured Polaribacter sp.]|uniref:vWA domain-containing protein n=1 Tax=uncultured Polaribacter sp. TaxID=174711 RepID=UPI00261EB467|nr:VWA domain-containing protein [uncultured Polaribacter sp.]